MKNAIYTIVTACLLGLGACKQFTDIQPKGQNILNRVEDLELVLNREYYQSGLSLTDAKVLVNDMLPHATNIPSLMTGQENSINKVLFTWNEEANRAGLTEVDYVYTDLYGLIGTVANPVILNADDAAGDRAQAKRLKAEALTLRAYLHYLLVNYYAKAYDPATAAADGGIPYARENDLLSVPNLQYTVGEVYDFILADLDEAFALNSLFDEGINKMRVGKSFACAAKAMVLMSKKDYTGALEAARASLAINDAVDDHNLMLDWVEDFITEEEVLAFVRPTMSSPEDLMFNIRDMAFSAFTPEMTACFEPGSVLLNYYERDPYGIFGDMFYGLDIEIWMLAENTRFTTCFPTTVDMHLTVAECLIRTGDIPGAMEILNTIRRNRILEDEYEEATASNAAQAIAVLKRVWRSENAVTGKNFLHMKRWNTEEDYRETLHKTVTYAGDDGVEVTKEYSLRPDSPLWIFPFPQDAMKYNTNLKQNY